MSATQNQIAGLANTVFAQGYLYATNKANSADWADDLLFGELENITVDFKESTEHVVGPESLYAIGAGATGRALSLKAQCAKIRARSLASLISNGALPTLDAGRTKISSNDATDFGNPCIQIHLLSPSAGDDIELKIYRAYATDLGLALALRKYVKPNWSAEAIYSAADAKTWELWLPGDQTTDTTTAIPAAPVLSLAVGTVGNHQLMLSWPAVANATSYSIERSLTSGTTGFSAIGDTTQLVWNDTESATGIAAWFRARAIGNGGYSLYSSVVTGTSA